MDGTASQRRRERARGFGRGTWCSNGSGGGEKRSTQPTGGTTHGTPANDRWCGPAPDAAGERVTATEGDTKGRTDPDGSRERGHERHRSRRQGPRSAAELDMIYTTCGALAGAARSCRQQPGGKTVVISSRASIRRHVLADCSPSSSSGQSQNQHQHHHHHHNHHQSPSQTVTIFSPSRASQHSTVALGEQGGAKAASLGSVWWSRRGRGICGVAGSPG